MVSFLFSDIKVNFLSPFRGFNVTIFMFFAV
jgi:hypothetical protein